MAEDSRRGRSGWSEPYLWLVVGLPLAAVVACLVTGLYILAGADSVISEERMPQAQALARSLGSAEGDKLPAVTGRNHSQSAGARHAKP